MEKPENKTRLTSLDICRGITVAVMILVNSSGSDFTYYELKHADWNGCTIADWVFPSFLVIVGISIVFSLGRRLANAGSWTQLVGGIARRSAIIFVFGLLISYVDFHSSSGIRVTGVLQRISVCYFICSLLFLTTSRRTQVFTTISLIVGYWLMLTKVPVPGVGPGVLTPDGNLASYLDRLLLHGHLYAQTHDPEGLLSTLSALATTLIGVLTGEWLNSNRTRGRVAGGTFVAGLVLCALGWMWSYWLPFNKSIWTSSYALWTGGLTLVGLAACYALVEILDIKSWGTPFTVLGRNALLAYFLSGLVYGIQEFIPVHMPGVAQGSLKLWICYTFFGSWLSPMNASMAYAITYVLLCWALMVELQRRNLFLKI